MRCSRKNRKAGQKILAVALPLNTWVCTLGDNISRSPDRLNEKAGLISKTTSSKNKVNT